MKLKWKVQPAPTGRYRSFERRSWPLAYVGAEVLVASISCEDAYAPWRLSNHEHGELTVRIVDRSNSGFVWRILKKRFGTLEAAKKGVAEFFGAHPEMLPKEEE